MVYACNRNMERKRTLHPKNKKNKLDEMIKWKTTAAEVVVEGSAGEATVLSLHYKLRLTTRKLNI